VDNHDATSSQKCHEGLLYVKTIAHIVNLQVYLLRTSSNQCFFSQSNLSRFSTTYVLVPMICNSPYDSSHVAHYQPLNDASKSPIPAYCSSQYIFLISHDISYLKQSNKNRCAHYNTHDNRHQVFRRTQKRGT
jgi:hypothetical protein